MPEKGMRRALVLILVVCLFAWLPFPGWADQCNYCHQEIEEGINPLKCPNCIKLANNITKSNTRVWVLEFKRGTIKRVQIKDDTGHTENYWFLPYTLTNKDDNPHHFFIDVTARSDRGRKKFRYHDVWIPEVYKEARKILGLREKDQLLSQRDLSMPPPEEKNETPRIDDKETRETAKLALPVIQPGEKMKCVAILGPFHPELDKLVISIRGLTNSSILEHDDYVAPEGKPNRREIKEAVLTLHYSRPGDEFAHDRDPLKYVGRRWTDVKRTIKSDLR